MPRAWLREEQTDLAVEKILDAASVAFLELGVSKASMQDVAKYAGCSRGTLYRYFKNRHQLHLAYVNHQARELSARVQAAIADIEDPRERLVEGVLRSLEEVRETPGPAAWFAAGDAGIAATTSRSSEVVGAVVAGFVDDLLGPIEAADPRDVASDDAERQIRVGWMLRMIVSLLAMPGETADEERALVSRFLVPVIFDGA